MKTILIADDDVDNRALARVVLELAHYQVIEAADGREALEVAFSRRPDLILLDLTMPKINGWEVAKQIRTNPSLRETPILAFSAHALVGDDFKAKAAGCDDYLPKPCLPSDIVTKVNELLNGGAYAFSARR